MSFWDFLAGTAAYFGGVGIRDGKHRGKFRAARRSTELKIAARNKSRAAKKAADATRAAGIGGKPKIKAPTVSASAAAAVKKMTDEATTPAEKRLSAAAAIAVKAGTTGGVTPQLARAAATEVVKAAQTQVVAPAVVQVAAQVIMQEAQKPPTPAAPPPPVLVVNAAKAVLAAAPPPPPPPSTSTTGPILRARLSSLAGILFDGLGDVAPPPPAPADELAYTDEQQTDPTLADVGYTPPAEVWVTTEPVQLYWNPIGTTKEQVKTGDRAGTILYNGGRQPYALEPITYPDGSPVVGHVWLPAINVAELNPTVYRNFLRKVGIGETRMRPDAPTDEIVDVYNETQMPPGYQYYGVNTTGYNGERSTFPASGGPEAKVAKYESGWVWADAKNYEWRQWDMLSSFDWRERNPTQQAYPWLYDNFGPPFLGWAKQPADLWRSDGKALSDGGALFLPGAPWPFACVEFIDSLLTGAHGLPQVIDDAGVFHEREFLDWCAAHAPWDRLLNVWRQGGAILFATVYDNKPARVISAPAPAPVDSATVPTEAAPGTVPGEEVPIDPTTGLPVDASGGMTVVGADGQVQSWEPFDPYGLPSAPTGPQMVAPPPAASTPWQLSPGLANTAPAPAPLYAPSLMPGPSSSSGQQWYGPQSGDYDEEALSLLEQEDDSADLDFDPSFDEEGGNLFADDEEGAEENAELVDLLEQVNR